MNHQSFVLHSSSGFSVQSPKEFPCGCLASGLFYIGDLGRSDLLYGGRRGSSGTKFVWGKRRTGKVYFWHMGEAEMWYIGWERTRLEALVLFYRGPLLPSCWVQRSF
ncbi:hypothetical protein GDO78_006994 [Eleutherodactylus coqui]|uniref:Uncharacterized protein n=1 Tax=Eleutherodactylus coqui TaxID=57060 RepID=A0A8J6FFM6_ELECQ|nr:hypothetical protein GDO78_006994 [Eleutherodactylus coqui]